MAKLLVIVLAALLSMTFRTHAEEDSEQRLQIAYRAMYEFVRSHGTATENAGKCVTVVSTEGHVMACILPDAELIELRMPVDISDEVRTPKGKLSHTSTRNCTLVFRIVLGNSEASPRSSCAVDDSFKRWFSTYGKFKLLTAEHTFLMFMRKQAKLERGS